MTHNKHIVSLCVGLVPASLVGLCLMREGGYFWSVCVGAYGAGGWVGLGLDQWFPNFFSSWPIGSWSTLAVAPSFKTSRTSSRIEKVITNLVISTMNVQANLSIITCYILIGQKVKKSKFQYQSLKNIFFQYAPMAPRQSPHGLLGGHMAPNLETTALDRQCHDCASVSFCASIHLVLPPKRSRSQKGHVRSPQGQSVMN